MQGKWLREARTGLRVPTPPQQRCAEISWQFSCFQFFGTGPVCVGIESKGPGSIGFRLMGLAHALAAEVLTKLQLMDQTRFLENTWHGKSISKICVNFCIASEDIVTTTQDLPIGI
jgi:hypothetical protein